MRLSKVGDRWVRQTAPKQKGLDNVSCPGRQVYLPEELRDSRSSLFPPGAPPAITGHHCFWLDPRSDRTQVMKRCPAPFFPSILGIEPRTISLSYTLGPLFNF